MPGLNIAELIKRQQTKPDRTIEYFLKMRRMEAIIDGMYDLLNQANEELKGMEELRADVVAKMDQEKGTAQ